MLAVAAVLALAAGAWVLARRRRRSLNEALAPADEVVAADAQADAQASIAIAPERPRVELAFVARRAGLNMLSATVEGELTLRNTSATTAEAVLVEATLIAARSGQEGELGALFARPIARPATPAFALAPGEERVIRIVAALPLAAIDPIVAGGRAMLIPLLAANATYRWGADGEGQTAASYLVGGTRDGQAKLAPFWLDAPTMHERVAARPHGLALER